MEPDRVAEIVRATPSGRYARRIWFFYEWLTEQTLELDDAERGNYVNAIDPDLQYAVEGINSRRHRVRDNLPGSRRFCPLVFRTEALERFEQRQLSDRAREVVADVPADLLARTAAFLLLDDSRSSYAIEGEAPSQNRIQRWGKVIGQAGKYPLDLAELLRLQDIVIGDSRFVRLGLRQDEDFVGEHDRRSGAPIPVHISAGADDLDDLMAGLLEFASDKASSLHPVIAAAVVAFGFVYIHPFSDGNGRIHRYLFHHVLSRRRFHPPGVIFPISSAILDRLDDYRRVLESYSERLLPLVEWESADDGKVRVLNDTADFYRFFDATEHAEFLFSCVEKTIEEDLPRETRFLSRYDEFCRRVQNLVDMPDPTQNLLFRFLHQNDGRLSKRARDREFSALTAQEVVKVEEIYEAVVGL